ncbi:hypothetical protein L3X38_042771 [Prunus dulcis]|uniref:Retrotransposon gag domain-containing protein n=1 Tax=Prunus dulcis TaxID=3755 RepID=A0AAD4UVH7_PRUDU|nr:hypothetical protein L3X38_042771 [Prunus dulcis]
MQLAKFGTTKEIWEHLERLDKRSNFAKRYQLESDLRATKQGDKNIQDFYNVMTVDAQNGPANVESNLMMRYVGSSAGKRAEALGEIGWWETCRRQNGRSNR